MSDTFVILKENFRKITKCVLKEKISKNPATRAKYEKQLKITYNALIRYTTDKQTKLSDEKFEKVVEIIIYLRERLVQCFAKLNLKIDIGNDVLSLIKETEQDTEPDSNPTEKQIEDELKEEEEEEEDDNDINDNLNDLDRTLHEDKVDTDIVDDKIDTEHDSEHNSEYNIDTDEEEYNDDKMDEAKVVEHLSRIFTKGEYDGAPLGKQTFLGQIRLAKTIIRDNHPDVFLAYLKSRLSGKALEHAEAAASVDDLVQALTNKIKHDNSGVIHGRIMALRADNNGKNEFSKKADELAEALRLAYISEGIPNEVSMKMTIKATVNMCRANARSDLVKSILAAKTYDSPSEVVAQYMIEIDTEKTEKQISAYRTMNRNRGNGRRFNGRNGGRNNYRNNGNRAYNSGNSGYRNSNQNGRYNGYRNNNGNNNNNNNGNNRGRYNNGYGNQNQGQSSRRDIRYMGNEERPAQAQRSGGRQQDQTDSEQED